MTKQISPRLFSLLTRRAATVAGTAIATLTLVYCSSINMFPVSEDQQLGAKFDAEIRQDKNEYPLLNNAEANRYLQTIISTVLTSPAVKYRGTFPYKVEIINNDKIVNAFCTPGGYIYVYTGLIKMLDNEASIAGVLGHEIAHAERRHSTSRMTKAYGLQTMMDYALGNTPNSNVALAANAFAGLGLLQNSRSDEDEADEYSFKYLQNTVYYPGAILYFFEKVKGRSGSSIERLLSSHPLPEDRIKSTNERLKAVNVPPPTETQLRTKEYRDFKSRIKN